MPQSEVDPTFHERLGRALGDEFEVLGLLGRGGFADVYQIRERRLDRCLALKVLRPEITLGPVMVSRFEREARALASLNHLNIPPVHFVGENEGLLYYVMPMIAGESLGDRLMKKGPVPPLEVVDIMVPVLEALDHAHHLGIVHRDIKPDNIVIEEETGRPLLVDFGVARQLKVNPPGGGPPAMVVGSPGYLSPEQITSPRDVDARSDIYAVGATMYHLLTGTMARDGRPPDAVHPGIPGWLSGVVMRALAPDGSARFRSAAEMAEALRVGRRSGSVEVSSLHQLVRQIRDEDPTPPMTAIAKNRVAQPWEQRSGPRRAAARPSRSAWPLYLGLVGTVAAYFLVVPVRLDLRNNLLLPIEFSTDAGGVWTMPPGGKISIRLSQQGRATGHWFVVEPVLPGGSRSAQEGVSGMIRIEGLTAVELLARRVHRSVDSWSDGGVIFAPRVINATARPVTVRVLRSNHPSYCNCIVGPGETQLLGYFRLESSSAVEVSDGPQRFAAFRNLESRINLNTGLVDLLVNDTILSRSPR